VILGKKQLRSKKKFKPEMSKERSNFTKGSKSEVHSKESVQIQEELSIEGQSKDNVQINEEASSDGTALTFYLKCFICLVFWINTQRHIYCLS
jgi:hypothetical protein